MVSCGWKILRESAGSCIEIAPDLNFVVIHKEVWRAGDLPESLRDINTSVCCLGIIALKSILIK